MWNGLGAYPDLVRRGSTPTQPDFLPTARTTFFFSLLQHDRQPSPTRTFKDRHNGLDCCVCFPLKPHLFVGFSLHEDVRVSGYSRPSLAGEASVVSTDGHQLDFPVRPSLACCLLNQICLIIGNESVGDRDVSGVLRLKARRRRLSP